MPFCFRWRISHFGAASTASSSVCAFLSLPCPVVRCSSAGGAEFRVLASWGPLLVLRQLKSSRSSSNLLRWLLSGFLPPTAGGSFIGGTSACSGPLLRVTAISLAFGLATAVFRCGGGFAHGYGWSPVFPSSGSG